MWQINGLCSLLLCLCGYLIETSLGSGRDGIYSSDVLSELKRELRNELLSEIRKEIKAEVWTQVKQTVQVECKAELQKVVEEQNENKEAKQLNNNNDGKQEMLQTELTMNVFDKVLDMLRQRIPEVFAPVSSQSPDFKYSINSVGDVLDKSLQSGQYGEGKDTKRFRKSTDAVLKPRAFHLNQVAFSVYLDHILDHVPSSHTIKFNQMQLNEGNFYNVHTGVFTAPVAGVYLFHFEFLGWSRGTELRLVVDNHIAASAVVEHQGTDSNRLVKAGSMTLVRVNTGQSVWVETYAKEDGNIIAAVSDRASSFMGILMY